MLAFPTPTADDGHWLQPTAITSNRSELLWTDLLADQPAVKLTLAPAQPKPAWLELTFAQPTTLRSIELPPIELLLARRNFDPDSRLTVQVADGAGWRDLVRHALPRGTWQDRLPEAQRKTWALTPPNPQAPLELADLADPVHLRIGKLLPVSAGLKR